MKPQIFLRALVGFMAGTFIGQIVNLCISLGLGGGAYIAVMPYLESLCATQLQAVFIQFVLTGLLGVIFAEASIVFLIERWSMLRQCMTHFAVTIVLYMPFVYVCWMPDNLRGVAAIAANLLVTYLITWLIQYRVNCRNVAQINHAIQEVNRNESH